jgi:hypothetical protein
MTERAERAIPDESLVSLVDVALRMHADKWGQVPQTIDAGWSEMLHWKDAQ